MFCVFGVSKKKCKAAAEKKVNAMRGELAPKTQKQHESLVAKLTEELFLKAKPTAISAELSTPSLVEDFIALAKKTGGMRALKGMRRAHKTDKKGVPQYQKRTKKPVFEWVELESNFTQESIKDEIF